MIYLLGGIAVTIAMALFFASKNKNRNNKSISTKNVSDLFLETTHSMQIVDEIHFNSKSNKWHIPEGYVKSDLDLTAFPPSDYKNVTPEIGMEATMWYPPVKRLVCINSITKNELGVCVEYSTRNKTFTLRKNGSYKEKYGSSELFLDVSETNFVEFKQWYSRAELEAGPLRGTDIRKFLPKNWSEFYL